MGIGKELIDNQTEFIYAPVSDQSPGQHKKITCFIDISLKSGKSALVSGFPYQLHGYFTDITNLAERVTEVQNFLPEDLLQYILGFIYFMVNSIMILNTQSRVGPCV
jgi:hypothetical protein